MSEDGAAFAVLNFSWTTPLTTLIRCRGVLSAFIPDELRLDIGKQNEGSDGIMKERVPWVRI